MANQFKKDTIDFDVYAKANPESRVDWGAEAKKISDSFAGVAKERTEKKAALETAFQNQQAALNELGEYDNPDVQTIVMNAGTDGANKLLDMKNMMKRGLVKPSDVTLFQQKQLSGFTLLKKNMANFDNTFKEYTTRLQTNMEGSDLPEGAPGEQWLAKQLEGFANMNNISVQTDPETGNLSMLRLDEEGEPIVGSSATLNRLTLLMKQKINNFDGGAAVTKIKDRAGVVTKSLVDSKYGQNAIITTEERSRLETEYYSSKEGQEFLDLEAQSMLSDPYDMQSFIKNSGLKTEDGTEYDVGDQEEYDAWNKEHPNNESNNPVLVMAFGKDNVYAAQFNDAQKKAAMDHAKTQITGSLNYSKTEEVKGLTQKPQPSAANIASGKADKKLLSRGKNLMFAVSGNAEEAEAGMRYLVDASNGQVESMQKTSTGFIVTYPGKDPMPISTEGKSPEESMRVTWKAAGLSDAEFDAWLDAGGKELLVDKQTTYDAINAEGPQSSIVYDPQASVQLDGNDVSAVDFIVDGPLGKSPSSLEFNTNAQFINEYSNLLNQESFFPKGIGAGKVTMKGDTMTFTIDGFAYDMGDVFGQTTTETVALMQEKIQDAINKRSKGGNASQY